MRDTATESPQMDDSTIPNNDVTQLDVMVRTGGSEDGTALSMDATTAAAATEEIVSDTPMPFRFTRRRDRICGCILCIVVLVVTVSIALPLSRRSGNSDDSDIAATENERDKDWTMIGDEISNSDFKDDEVLAISLALSDDGQIVAVGNRHTPYVRLYKFEPDRNQSWVQMGSDLVGYDDSYGYDVALSGDGRTVAIGGPKQNAVQVFKFNATNQWNMIGGSIRGDMFLGELAGAAISLSLNGRVIAVGAHLNSDQYQRSGQVRAFQLNDDDTKWEPLGSDINGDSFGDQFGGAISLSNDGFTLAVGARFHDDTVTSTSNIGHVRVYRFVDNEWITIGTDIEGDEVNEGFGYSVSLSGDGSTCAIGNTNSELAVYRRTETEEWLSVGTSIPPTLLGDDVYAYVSLSRDGNVLAVLEYRSYNGGSQPSVTIFRYDEIQSTWQQVGGELNGAGLALSADGSILAVGGVNNDGLEYVRVLTAV